MARGPGAGLEGRRRGGAVHAHKVRETNGLRVSCWFIPVFDGDSEIQIVHPLQCPPRKDPFYILNRMDLFDRILSADPPIVRGSGDLVKCMDDQVEGFMVSDMLRQMLLCEESENAVLYSEADKEQFLWRVFEHLCLGGACCQFEVRESTIPS